MAGYSGTPLIKKLGIQPGQRLAVINFAPVDYLRLFDPPLPEIVFAAIGEARLDFIHAFCTSSAELHAGFTKWKEALSPTGMLWISWPKRGSRLAGDLNENIVREAGLARGLVDVKVCAVDSTWSGLKFVYRLKDR